MVPGGAEASGWEEARGRITQGPHPRVARTTPCNTRGPSTFPTEPPWRYKSDTVNSNTVKPKFLLKLKFLSDHLMASLDIKRNNSRFIL